MVSREQALAAGLSPGALRHRLRPGGPWSVWLPGVYQTETGPPTQAQGETAALLYGGPDSALTGTAALQAVLPRLTRGSVLAFDEIGHPKWPGETAAFREVLGFGQPLKILGGLGTLAYLRWGSQ